MLRAAVAVVAVVCAWTVAVAAAGSSSRAGDRSAVASALVPNAIAFWDQEHGLIGTGFRYCGVGRCNGGTISSTTDGGRTSRVLLRTRQPVTWVAVAPPGQAWALSGGALLHSSNSGRSWKRLGADVSAPSFADARHGMSCRAGCPEGHKLQITNDGGLHWQQIVGPCGRAVAGVRGLSLVTPTMGWVLCVGQPGAGNQGKVIYKTTDSGNNWHRLLSSPIGGGGGGISSYGYPLGISFNAAGVGLLWESRGTLQRLRRGLWGRWLSGLSPSSRRCERRVMRRAILSARFEPRRHRNGATPSG